MNRALVAPVMSILLAQNNFSVLLSVTADGAFPAFLVDCLSLALVFEQQGLLHPEHHFRGFCSDFHHGTSNSRY